MGFEGKVALVTGASRGIGRAIAEKLASKGAAVAVVYAGNTAAAAEAVAAVQKAGVAAKAYRCDVADFAQVEAMCAQVKQELGAVDILVNNAGITRDALVLSMKENEFDEVIATNLKGAFNTIKHLYAPFMKRRAGRIINITSVVGLCGNAGQANYAAAKAGLVGLTKSTARELAARGVTCNAIAPGFIETEMTDVLSDKVREKMLCAIPQKRPGTADEVAEVVAFLASDAAGYITGEVIRVDGGMCM